MSIIGTPRKYAQKWAFAVEIDGLEVAWFETAGPLESEFGIVEQHEGGSIVVASQRPGKIKFAPVTLTLGQTNNNEIYNWHLQCGDAAANGASPDADLLKTAAIIGKGRDGSEERRFTLFEAWPQKFKAADYDAKAEENVIEEVILVYRYYVKKEKNAA